MLLRVYLPSRAAVGVLGPVLDAAATAGHALQILTDPNPKDPIVSADVATWLTWRWRGTPDAILGLAGDPRATWGVPSWWDNIFERPVPGQTVGYLSAWHRDQHAAAFPDCRGWIQQQPVVGWTLADHRALLPAIREPRWRTVLFSLKRRIPEPWRRSLRGRRWYWERVRAWARWAAPDRLLIKTRAKHGDPWWLPWYGEVVPTQTAYPSTSLRVLSTACVVGHFTSGAALEARLFPHLEGRVINEAVPLTHLAHLPGVEATYRHMFEDPLDRVITYDDTATGQRILDCLTRP